jgi:hypothetical protein
MPSAAHDDTTGPAHLKCAACHLIVSEEFEVGQLGTKNQTAGPPAAADVLP